METIVEDAETEYELGNEVINQLILVYMNHVFHQLIDKDRSLEQLISPLTQ